MFEQVNVYANDNYIEYRLQESDELVYKKQINSVIEDSGATMQNIEYPFPTYYIHLKNNFGETLDCGNIINTFFNALKAQIDGVVIVVDFDDVIEISSNFCSQYCKYLLTTKNKIININQNTDITNIFAQFIITNSYDIETNEILQDLKNEI